MSFSYSGDPSINALDEVRFLIGDVNSSQPQLQDEEINYCLGVTANNRYAAAMAAEAIAGKYAVLVNTTIDGLSVQYNDLHRNYILLADQLRTGQPLVAAPYAGGISRSDKLNNYMDTDRTTITTTRHMHMEQAIRHVGDAEDVVEPVQGDTSNLP
jgi:hypothetical protein